jgi:hypothetical protein
MKVTDVIFRSKLKSFAAQAEVDIQSNLESLAEYIKNRAGRTATDLLVHDIRLESMIDKHLALRKHLIATKTTIEQLDK